MREIKFRGKNDFNDEWYYGYLFLNKTEDGYCVGYLHDYADVIESTVGQFTGLRDTDGREIYEGDIVRVDSYGEESVHKVIYGGLDGHYPAFDLDPDLECECNCLSYCMADSDTTITVIGNVYDNPDLLEVAHD